MKVAIIGGGFTGLAAAIGLVDNGCEVEVYEAGERLGGLAGGFKPKGWKWSLEKYYHHIFTNDREIIGVSKKVGWPAYFLSPVTKTWKGGIMAELDSPSALLRYGQLSVWGRLRMAMGLAVLKLVMWPRLGMLFERFLVVKTLPLLVGREGYEKIWKPMLMAKFGREVGQVNLAWFWARVYKRTKKLGYFNEGFERLAEKMGEYVEKKGGQIRMQTNIKEVKREEKSWRVNGERYDQVLITAPMPLAEELLEQKVARKKIGYLWGQTLVMELDESLMDCYWLNILEKDWPFLVVVEHTRLVDKRHYGGKRVVYVGNYLAADDVRLTMSEGELLGLFEPYLKQVNPRFKKGWVRRMWKFQSPFAQPVFPVNYSRNLPRMSGGKKGLWLANMSMVYPWDRGTNYAVDLGTRVAQLMLDEQREKL